MFAGVRRAALGAALLVGMSGCSYRPPSGAAAIVLVGDASDTVRLASPAARIVSLSPATTEILFAIGAGGQLVGRTRWCDWPAAAAAVTSVGDGLEPNLEAVIAVRPDLVLLYPSPRTAPAVARLRDLGVPALQLRSDRLGDVTRLASLLGRGTGHTADADTMNARFTAELAAATQPGARSRPSVLLLAWDDPPIVLGRGSFLSELVDRAGGRNLFEDIAQPSAPVSVEAIASRNPERILTGADGEPPASRRAAFRVIPAVREGRWLRAIGSEYNRPSPRAPAAIRRLAEQLRGVAP